MAAIVLRQVHPEFPLNGQILALVATLAAIGVYVAVSLVTCRRPHDMDKLLHRGRYALAEDGIPLPEVVKPPRTWQSLIGVITIWFEWGGIRDLGRLFSRLGNKRGDSDDDGEMVKNDPNP